MQVNIEEFIQRGQPQVGTYFKFIVPTIPSVVGGDARSITIQTRTLSKPGHKNDKLEISYYGFKLSYPGKMDYDGSFSTDFIMMEDKKVYKIIERWVNAAQSVITGNGNPADVVKTLGIGRSYSVNGVVTGEWHYKGLWPTECPNDEYAQDDKEKIVSVTWSYDVIIPIS